jgi:hypothetical protein
MEFLSSYGLAAVLFLFLFLLTYLGTIEQAEHGLYLTQKKYFESVYLLHNVGPISVPLPGVYLLLIMLFVNVLLGGVLRLRRGVSQIGILIAHCGMLVLLIGGFVTFKYSFNGHMTLFEGQRSNAVRSYHDWELVIRGAAPNSQGKEYVIPGQDFVSAEGERLARFTSTEMPFDLTISNFAPNAEPRLEAPLFPADYPVVDGVYLEPLPQEKQNERNVAGAYVTLSDKSSGDGQTMVIWGLQREPARFTFGEQPWSVDLRRKEWSIPFTISLNKFTRELYPGTRMPKAFESEVTKIEEGSQQRVKIAMNQPLRHEGFTFYQASWGPQDAGPNDPLFSTFAVVKNPADKFPLYSCIIITLGMLVHFSFKLRKFLRAEQRRR